MAIIHIDGKSYDVKEGRNLLEACLSLGIDLPYFCWHPALGSVGACRQCAVKSFKDEKDTKGRLIMSCMEPVKDQLRISVTDQEASAFREQVIGWLMTNHPHDCAVCDEGGSCHLQDMTVMTGHSYRNYHFTKRTYKNQYLGPFLNHEMNRCIQCYRCVRFYKDFAGGKDMDVFAAHNHVYFGRHKEGTLESEFSGNLAEICPTGVFTDKTLKQHYTRKWDMTYAPSICQGCSLGCNIIAGERYGSLRQISTRYNGAVNGYFLCDRGRYGYEFVNSPRRIREIAIRNSTLATITADDALRHLKDKLTGGRVIGIGSPRASLESNFVLQQLVGQDQFYLGMTHTEHDLATLALKILKQGPVRTPSMQEAAAADAVLILGEDLLNTAPMLGLAVRQAVRRQPTQDAMNAAHVLAWQDAAVREAMQDRNGPCFILNIQPTGLDEIATRAYHAAPDNIARIGFAVAQVLGAPVTVITDLTEEERQLVQQIADALSAAARPLIIAGYGMGNEASLRAAADVSWALHAQGKPAMLSFTMPECNTLGLEMLGGLRLDSAVDAVLNGEVDTVIVLENDLYRRMDKHTADHFLKHCKDLVLLDHLYNATAEKATVLLPAGSFAESDGTLVNNEGRAQRFFQVYGATGAIQESWRWLLQLGAITGNERLRHMQFLDDVTEAIAKRQPVFAGIDHLTPPADFRIAGQKIPREPHRYSGRTAMQANVNVSEPKPPVDDDTALSFTMEGYRGEPPSSMIPFFWWPGWNSVQSINKFQVEIGGSLHDGDPGKRLLEPNGNSNGNGHIPWFTDAPEHFVPMAGHLLMVPVYHIYGSEELSVHTPGIAERSPGAPYIMLNPDDAKRYEVAEHHQLQLAVNGHPYTFTVKINPALHRGMAGVPVGLQGIGIAEVPELGKL
ncbi:NADH-quinone oxidoreductase subunit NuoG [Chitinophaga agrisoli]|uniref:NADH-quinone oxidoreductase subunit G n=1 Tax=Chitinophaga agrisoli TaxID=2607653 RepID=A0A5B2VTF8_9BACT|nr:NADH-quinone oxidoreductase subunit NuoG [Chitinophaga agrisoli]KAA2243093.1 NADH-quinone oxidoreductase subunit NuoG [Chitinophaga agrisoli]